MFNWAKKQGLTNVDPTSGIEFFPVAKKLKYVPPQEDIEKVIAVADQDTRDYLITIRDTLGRMIEINRLTWDDIDFQAGLVILYTRKKRGGDLTPRAVPMTNRLYEVLTRRFNERDESKPWVFWHTYWSRKAGEMKQGPFQDRKKFMKTLCKKAGVRYFRFHALRHAGASLMDNSNVPIGSIQRILGHENRKTTEIYLHGIGKSEREAMDIFSDATKKSLSKSLSAQKKGLRLMT